MIGLMIPALPLHLDIQYNYSYCWCGHGLLYELLQGTMIGANFVKYPSRIEQIVDILPVYRYYNSYFLKMLSNKYFLFNKCFS